MAPEWITIRPLTWITIRSLLTVLVGGGLASKGRVGAAVASKPDVGVELSRESVVTPVDGVQAVVVGYLLPTAFRPSVGMLAPWPLALRR